MKSPNCQIKNLTKFSRYTVVYTDIWYMYLQAQHKDKLIALCVEGTGDISEFQYLLNQPGVEPNLYDKVNCDDGINLCV